MLGYAVLLAAFVNFAETEIIMHPKRNISITILLVVIIGCVHWNDLKQFMSSEQNINFLDSNFESSVPSKTNSNNTELPKSISPKKTETKPGI